jgi:predicted acetyltransferase
MTLILVTPARDHLPAYIEALQRGWSPDNTGGGEATRLAQLEKIEKDPGHFLASLDDPEARGGDIRQPDGTMARRLPGIIRWMWDGEFCGSIGFRWQAGTEALPPHVLGHVGYAVVPWKRRLGYATEALRLMLPEARARGLRWIEITAEPDNLPSHRVIEANGGVFVGRFEKPEAYGGHEGMRWRVDL